MPTTRKARGDKGAPRRRTVKRLIETPPEDFVFPLVGELKVDQWGVPYLIDDTKNDPELVPTQRTKEQSDEMRTRLNQIRTALNTVTNHIDIRNYYANRWGVSPSRISSYIRTAREMNRQILDVTPEQAKADSVSFWSVESQNFTAERVRSEKLINQSDDLLRQSKEALGLGISTGNSEYIASARDLCQRARELLALARVIKREATDRVFETRDRLDKMLGTHAPVKVAVEVSGQVEHNVKQEPITFDEVIRVLAKAAHENPQLQLADKFYLEMAKLEGNIIPGETVNEGV